MRQKAGLSRICSAALNLRIKVCQRTVVLFTSDINDQENRFSSEKLSFLGPLFILHLFKVDYNSNQDREISADKDLVNGPSENASEKWGVPKVIPICPSLHSDLIPLVNFRSRFVFVL